MDAIATPLTGKMPGAIAVIRLHGTDAPKVLQTVAPSVRVGAQQPGQVARANLLDSAGQIIDDALIVRVEGSPAAYELHTHGGIALVDAVLDRLRAAGARVLAPEDWLAQSGALEDELLLALQRAVTDTGVRLLLAQPRVWPVWTRRWQQWLQSHTAAAELWPLHAAAQWILHRSQTLRRLFEPARVAIVGPPNAGKSTLANALLGRPVAITSAQAGTTRDWVDARAIFAAPPRAAGERPVHVSVTLVDTAGVRDTPDALEQESIARTRHQAASADLVLFLTDATRDPTPEELALLEALAPSALVIACNKADLPGATLPSTLAACGGLLISARTHAGLAELMRAALRQLDMAIVAEECYAFSTRRRDLLAQLSTCDEAIRCASLLSALGSNSGEAPLQ